MPERCPKLYRGHPCTRPPGPDGLCQMHSPASARARGRQGGQAHAQARRSVLSMPAPEVRVGSADEVRAVLVHALELAARTGNVGALIRGCQVANEILRTVELERELAEMRELFAQKFPDLARRNS
jgi:hypothetical protein